MKRINKFLSLFFSMLIILSIILTSTAVSAATAEITYTFKNNLPGFAEGTITLTPSNGNFGTYYLYWGDDTAALKNYGEIAILTVNSGTGKVEMPKNSAIPADATNILVFKTEEELYKDDRTTENADAIYSIPAEKQLSFDTKDALYTFGAISDPQIANDSYGSNSYPYDETHLKAAFETLHDRKVDFTISSGDTVNDQNGNKTYSAEYKVYQQILADSNYTKPIYEANGNHDVGTVWNKNGNYYNDNEPFILATGLDSNAETIKKGLPYFEITEPVTGDHFIFMALEGGFYTNKGTQFSKAQLDWLEGLLKKYSPDGKNIFIIEHANVTGWGSGDKLTQPYYYDLALEKGNSDVARFVSLMETYKECVVITGHTHLELSAQYNYSDNEGTSAVILHNSAIGGVRRLINGNIDRTAVKGLSEGYIVEVYKDCILFNGTNMYYNETMPQCCYIVPMDTSLKEDPPTQPNPTQYKYGDADLSGNVNVKDATAIQKHAASIISLEDLALVQAEVTGDSTVNVRDATAIQKFVAEIISTFPIEQNSKDIAQTGALAPPYERAKGVLKNYYTYSSYDQYQNLKYEFRLSHFNEPNFDVEPILLACEEELIKTVTAIGSNVDSPVAGEITVYFVNNKNWNKVCAYVWDESGSSPISWPGAEMTKSTTNSYNEDVYSFTVNYEKYQNIIFNNGSGQQTSDIAIVPEDGVGYYISGGSSPNFTVETY